jgi:hypothetical protein
MIGPRPEHGGSGTGWGAAVGGAAGSDRDIACEAVAEYMGTLRVSLDELMRFLRNLDPTVARMFGIR